MPLIELFRALRTAVPFKSFAERLDTVDALMASMRGAVACDWMRTAGMTRFFSVWCDIMLYVCRDNDRQISPLPFSAAVDVVNIVVDILTRNKLHT